MIGARNDLQVENVIMIIADTLRRDALSCFGGNWIRTPHIDRFAERAMTFDNAFVSSFPTVLLRNDLLTGRYTFTYKGWQPIDEDAVTLQETLSKAGILTSLVADTPNAFSPAFNYQRGFDAWHVIQGQEGDPFRSAPREVKLPCAPHKLRYGTQQVIPYLRNVAARRNEEDCFVAQTMTTAAEWLEENRDGRRFFLYADTFDPHEPWDPPRYYVERFDSGYEGEEVIYPRYDFWDEFLSEKELQHCRALYAAEVTLVDRWIDVLLERIDSLDLWKNTAVILVSDHGFYFGEHGFIGKFVTPGSVCQRMPLYPELTHVPLFIYLPGCHPGSHIKALVQQVDLMPTVLDLLGVERPASVASTSLAPLLDGRAHGLKEIAVSSMQVYDRRKPAPPSSATASSITDGEWLLISGMISPELYHVVQDPKCEKNLISENSSVAANLHNAYMEFLKAENIPENHLRYLERSWNR